MWADLINALNKDVENDEKIRSRLFMLFICTCIVSLSCAFLAIYIPGLGTFEKPVYSPVLKRVLLLASDSAETQLLRTLLDWCVFALGFAVFIGGITNYLLTKSISYLTLSLTFITMALGSILPSLSLSRLLYSEGSPMTFLVYTWFFLRFLYIYALSIGLACAAGGRRTGFWLTLFLLVAGLAVFTYYHLYSPDAFHLLFSRNFLTLNLFVMPMFGWAVLVAPLTFLFLKRQPSYFAFTLCLSVIPHLIFEGAVLYEKSIVLYTGFNGVHLIELFAFLLPCIGLYLDQIGVYHTLQQEKFKSTRATEAKLFFLSSMTGEIQMTVDRLLAYVQEFRSQASQSASAVLSHIMNGIGEMAWKLKTMVENFNSSAAFEEGEIHLNQKITHLDELLKGVLENAPNQVDIEGSIQRPIMTDAFRLRQYFNNLLELHKLGKVLLQVQKQEHSVQLILTEETPQRTEEEIELLFEKGENRSKESWLVEISTKIAQELGTAYSTEIDERRITWKLTLPVVGEETQ